MNIQGIDTAHKLTSAEAKAVKDCGMQFVCRYLVPNLNETAWKALTAPEAEDIRSNDLAILLLWETTTARAKQGRSAGDDDGNTARELAKEMNIPETCAIYFCVDYDAPSYDYPAIDEYLYGAKQAVAPYRVGVYGKADLVNSVKADCYMQCVAWSGGVLSEKANVYQYQWQGGAEAQEMKKRVGFYVDLDCCNDMVNAGMWMPKTETAKTLDKQIAEATEWAKKEGIFVDGMHDVGQCLLLLYNYRNSSLPT